MPTRSKKAKKRPYELELFVSGLTSKSIRTIDRLRTICEDHMPNAYCLKIIDIYKNPELAKENDVFAVPTLIKRAPGRKRVFIGDLTEATSVYSALGLPAPGRKS